MQIDAPIRCAGRGIAASLGLAAIACVSSSQWVGVPSLRYPAGYSRPPASAITVKLHDARTLFAAHQKPTLSSLVLGGLIAVTHPVTSRLRFRITSTVGAFLLKLLVPPAGRSPW